MNLLQEISKGSVQADLKTSDGSSAGSTDVTGQTDDVSFSSMRNMINRDGQVTGSDVNDYLERAEDLNDEVESVGFAVETDDGDIIKIYVNATESDAFEEALAKLLGLEGDTEEAINQLAQDFDIIDVVWPQDPEGDLEQDPDADLTIDDTDDLGGEEGEEPAADGVPPDAEIDAAASADGEAPVDGDTPAGDEPTDGEEPVDGEPTDDAPIDGEAPPGADVDDEGFLDIPAAGGDEPTDDASEEPAEDEMEPVLNDDGSQKLDKDGEPVMRKKKKEPESEVTEEGLKARMTRLIGQLDEAARDDLQQHIDAVDALGNAGKYTITVRECGGNRGLRTAALKRAGSIAYFESEDAAKAEADRLNRLRNRAGAVAAFTYTPTLVENKQPQAKDNTMTIGSKFLERLSEAADKDSVKDGMSIPLDAQQKALVSQLKKPLEKRIVAFFAMAGIIGRLLNTEDSVVAGIRDGGEKLRKNVSVRKTFDAFYSELANAKGYSIEEPVTEAAEPASAQKQFIKGLVSAFTDYFSPDMTPKEMARTVSDIIHDDSKAKQRRANELGIFDLSDKELADMIKGTGLVTEAAAPSSRRVREDVAEKQLRGSATQKKLERVMVALGLPRALVSTSGPGQLEPFLRDTASLIDETAELETSLKLLATRLGVSSQEEKPAAKAVEEGKLQELATVKVVDPFSKDVVALLTVLGIPQEHLAYKPNDLRAAFMATGKSLGQKAMIMQKMGALADLIRDNKRAEKKTQQPAGKQVVNSSLLPRLQGLTLTEAFGELEALVDSDLEAYGIHEPQGGPAMRAAYDGSGAHSETLMLLGVDPEAGGAKTLRVGVDGPWDGVMHSRLFTDDKDGYKQALDYANKLRSANLRTGGQPKGWK